MSSVLVRWLRGVALVLAPLTAASAQVDERFGPGPPVPTGVRDAERLSRSTVNTTVLDVESPATPGAVRVEDLLGGVPGLTGLGLRGRPAGGPLDQWISVRAAGPGGASRALVLLDGTPLNDPFAGFVSWHRLALDDLARIEVSRGAGPTVWGSSGTGGLVHLLSREAPAGPGASGRGWAEGSTAGDAEGRLGAERRGSWWSIRVEGAGGTEAGGRREGNAAPGAGIGVTSLDHHATSARVTAGTGPARIALTGWHAEDLWTLGASEDRSRIEAGGAHLSLRIGSVGPGQWDAAVSGHHHLLRSRTVGSPSGNEEAGPALERAVPAEALDAVLQWTRRFRRQNGSPGPHLFVAGADVHAVDGESRELSVEPGVGSRRRRAGGRQTLVGLFGQDVDSVLPSLEASFGARLAWWNSAAAVVEGDGPGGSGRARVPDRDAVHFGIRTTARWVLGDDIALRAAVAEGFRPPTLEEQYGTTRRGSEVTLANPRLDPERTSTGEVGVEYRGLATLVLRAAGFWTEVFDAIGPVTLAAGRSGAECGPGATCRRRQNLDQARVLGVEVETSYRPARWWWLDAGYLFQHARVIRATVRPGLRGRPLAEVPGHQGTVGLGLGPAGGPTLSAQLRALGPRPGDDAGRLRLRGAVRLDLAGAWPLPGLGELYVAVDNLLDARVEAARGGDGLVDSGPDRRVRGGVRFRF